MMIALKSQKIFSREICTYHVPIFMKSDVGRKCFLAKVQSNWSLCMSLASGAIEYSRLHVFWLKFIPLVCMLMGEDAIQLSSLYVFGLEVTHDVVWLVYGSTTYFISFEQFTCFWAGAISSPWLVSRTFL